MSNKLVRTKPETNGHTPKGGRERALPSFLTDTGYRIAYRTLSPETMPRLEAAARQALAGEQPALPTQRMEVGPGEFRDVENPHDEEYQKALEDWEAKVQSDQGMRFLTLCEQYALVYEVDEEEVKALKAAFAASGAPIEGESDAQIFLWRIALPAPEDQMTLYAKLFGGLTEEAIQAQKASFLGQLQGRIAQTGA